MSTTKKYSCAPKFSKTGYHTWKSKLNLFLRGHKQSHLVLTTNRPPANLNHGEDRKEWDVRNDIALSRLAEAVDEPENRAAERIVLTMTEQGRNAKQIIDALKEKFFIEDNHVRIHATNLFSNARFLPNEPGISFISRLEDMKTNLNNLGKEVDDDTDMLGQLMSAMNSDKRFEITLAAMKAQPDITWDKAVAMLSTQIGEDIPMEHAKFSDHRSSNERPEPPNPSNNPCQICNKKGHSAKKCRYRYKNSDKNQNDSKGGGGGKKDKSNITCYRCQKKGHYSNECPNKKGKKKGDLSGWDSEDDVANMMKEQQSEGTCN